MGLSKGRKHKKRKKDFSTNHSNPIKEKEILRASFDWVKEELKRVKCAMKGVRAEMANLEDESSKMNQDLRVMEGELETKKIAFVKVRERPSSDLKRRRRSDRFYSFVPKVAILRNQLAVMKRKLTSKHESLEDQRQQKQRLHLEAKEIGLKLRGDKKLSIKLEESVEEGRIISLKESAEASGVKGKKRKDPLLSATEEPTKNAVEFVKSEKKRNRRKKERSLAASSVASTSTPALVPPVSPLPDAAVAPVSPTRSVDEPAGIPGRGSLSWRKILAASGLKAGDVKRLSQQYGYPYKTGTFSRAENEVILQAMRDWVDSNGLTWEDGVALARSRRSEMPSDTSTDNLKAVLQSFAPTITAALDLRPKFAVVHHMRSLLSPLPKGMWTAKEVAALKRAVTLHGNCWTLIGDEVGREAESCRIKWRDFDCPEAESRRHETRAREEFEAPKEPAKANTTASGHLMLARGVASNKIDLEEIDELDSEQGEEVDMLDSV